MTFASFTTASTYSDRGQLIKAAYPLDSLANLFPPTGIKMSSPDLVGHEKDAIQDQLEDGPSRYAAYLMRLRTLITASSRYIAYSSDIGEAFRPLTSDAFVRSAYAVSWAYLALDVGYTGYKAHLAQHQSLDPLKPVHDAVAAAKGKAGQIDVANDPTLSKSHSEATNIGLVVARRAVFQSIASMALPAFTIHSIVRYTAPVFAKASSARIRSAGPTIAGLAFVPALPFVFDEPVEHVVDAAFDFVESKWNPQAAKEGVGKSTEDAKEHIVQAAESLKKTGAEMEKEALKAKDGLLSLVGAGDDTPADKTTSAIQKAMLLGIGVDVLYLPRMRGMLQRQARRMAPGLKMAASASTTTAIQPATVQAGMRLAEKIGSERERREFRRLFVDSRVGLQAAWQRELPDNGRAIRWLALR